MINHRETQLALRGRLLTVSGGVPAVCAWDNSQVTPPTGAAYLEEDYVPGTSAVPTLRVSAGRQYDTGLYVLRYYAPADTGLAAIATPCDTILAHFAPGTTMTTTSGEIVRVRADVAPTRGALQRVDGGWVVCTITIPWTTYTTPA